MVGSGDLVWPTDLKEHLSMRIELLQLIGSGEEDIPNFCVKFLYSENNLNTMVADFNRQISAPTLRDARRLVERSGASSAWEAEALPLDDTRWMLGIRRFYSRTV